MSPLAPFRVTAAGAAEAYGRTAGGSAADGGSFGATMQSLLRNTLDSGHDADAKSMLAIAGQGDIGEVVTAVSKAELALQTTVAVRDRVVQAYQDIMRMAI